jgi:hypothetical protein
MCMVPQYKDDNGDNSEVDKGRSLHNKLFAMSRYAKMVLLLTTNYFSVGNCVNHC